MGTKDTTTARWFAIAKHAGQMYGQHPYSYHLDDAAIRTNGPAALAVKLADRLANAKTSGLAKDESAMLSLYRKEQPAFEDNLRPFAGVMAPSLDGFDPAFRKIREYLGMEQKP